MVFTLRMLEEAQWHQAWIGDKSLSAAERQR